MKLQKEKENKIMNEVLEKIQKIGIVPVVVLNDAKDAEPLAKLFAMEDFHVQRLLSVQMQQRSQSVSCLMKYPEMLVGAGTVLTTEQVDRAVAAGAKFIVSPRTES